MARDRLFTSEQYKIAIDELKEKDVLGLGIVENKDAFMLAVALGFNQPQALKKKVGLSLLTALKTADKALIASVLMGLASDDSDIDEYADLDKSIELCEQYAETGYQILQKKYNDADCDVEIMERHMIKELEKLYTKNIISNL